MESLKTVLMRKFDYTEDEAQDEIDSCRFDLMQRIDEGEMPDDICQEYWGLEPDYLDELL